MSQSLTRRRFSLFISAVVAGGAIQLPWDAPDAAPGGTAPGDAAGETLVSRFTARVAGAYEITGHAAVGPSETLVLRVNDEIISAYPHKRAPDENVLVSVRAAFHAEAGDCAELVLLDRVVPSTFGADDAV
ncbi:MAG: hypothetical protein ACM31O_01695 [Bacteroidota bacterium]